MKNNNIGVGILAYSRSSNDGGKVKKHHINEISNAICVARRETTAFYVIEWHL